MRPGGDRLVVRRLGQVDFAPTFEAMRAFTAARTDQSPDEIWLVQHPPIFTLGQAGRAEHILDCADIPLVHTDRGGQVTYHGPGQVIAYVLLDLHRAGLKVREVVSALEQAVIDLLAGFGISAERQAGAPGVYVKGAKIAALGLRVRQGRCYHGVSLNVDMDLSPFARIHPCGYPGLKVTQLAELTEGGACQPPERVAEKLLDALVQALRLPAEEKC